MLKYIMGICKTKDNIIKEIAKPTFDAIASMESELSTELDTDRKGTIYLNLSKEYKTMFYQYKDFLDEGMCKICEDENKIKCYEKNQIQKHYIQLSKGYLWKSVYYREKLLIMIKELGVIDYYSNSNIFMDVDLKYRYFVEYSYTFKPDENEKDFYFDVFGETQNESINTIINDLRSANRAYYYIIKRYEEDKNYEELSIWYEVRGDLYLAIQLLLMQAGEGLSDNAKLAYDCYKKRFENLQMFADPKTAYGGIVGMPYQTNFFDMLLKQSEFWGSYYGSVQDKKNLAEWILNDCPKEFKPYGEKSDRDFLPSKERFDKRIQDLFEENPSLKFNSNIDDWKAVIEYFHSLLLYHYKERYLNTYVDNWKREDDMQKWVQREIDQHLVQNKPPFTSGREATMGGGNCDHYYKNIPICDKWKRDSNASSYPIKIFDFVDKVCEKLKAQFFSYVQDVKLGVIVIIDSRTVTKENKNPDAVDCCYRFKVDKINNIDVCYAIFVFQVLDKTPSERK